MISGFFMKMISGYWSSSDIQSRVWESGVESHRIKKIVCYSALPLVRERG
jgi:hypothetical protein